MIDLAQVQMSPSGTKFKKPVEVVTQISSFEDEEDIEWQFADNDLKSRTIWQKATRASSKEEAKQLAVSEEPHVSFCIENRKMYAYYMHFTLGRILFKRVTSKCLECSVYCGAADGGPLTRANASAAIAYRACALALGRP